MAHETSTGSSPIVKGLMNNLREILPQDQMPKLDSYAARAEATKPERDYHRARFCLHWAIKTAESSEHSHLHGLAIRLKETHKEWQDIWLGAWFGSEVEAGIGVPAQEIKGDQKVGPGEDIELLWVEEATDVAKSAAATSGWSNVPWEELLDGVLNIG
ncbi:MAG TPA: hypothetical protein VGF51_01915 [Acidimicrobiales bacterium]|jgi:hypothetical protein